mgnify:CR=1 FL=1
MARGFIKRENLTRDTLAVIAALGILTIAVTVSPYFLNEVSKVFFKDKSLAKRRARAKKLRELEKRRLISFKELGGSKVKIELTKGGQKLVRTYDLDQMQLSKPKKWDGFWRIITYDIPNSKRRASDAFREKLRSLGLFQLQKSVWVSPFECLAEIEFLTTVFEIEVGRYIHYFKTKEVPLEGEIRDFFELPGS